MTLVAQSLPHATARPQGAAVADKSIGIDALRGLAALLVAYMHARQTNWIGASTYFAGGGEGWSAGTLIAALTMPATFGAAGVSIFFVISGYVIHRSQAERAAATGTYGLDARNFLWRRFVRIYSVLTVAMLMTAALDSYGRALAPALYARFDDGFLAFVLNQLTLQGIASAPFGSNHPLWSLSVEMHFYLLYPLLLVAMQRFGAAVVFAVIVASNVVSWAMFEQREYVVFTSYYAIWCAGAYLAEWRARETAGAQQLGRRVAWAALILAGGAGCLASVARMNFVAFQLWGVAAVGLVALVLATPRSLGPVARFAAAFGAFSYSLYACHAPIVIAMNALIFEGRQMKSIWPTVWIFGVTVVAGAVVYVLVERPILNYLASARTFGKAGRT